jgi:SIR2-like domain
MRFLADGPSIPDELLVARDEGRVIFFCGAGVSRARAGLSDFFGLAQRVSEILGIAADSPAKRLIEAAREIDSRTGISGLISADRVFGLLEREFLVKDIQAAVAESLKSGPDVDLSAHRLMLDLGTGPDGKVCLVTTNFDLLFEACDSTLRTWKPPRLPEAHHHEDFEGIIHLHGRVNQNYSGADGDGFVLSSSEFGRAYLSEGWATQFIQSVLDRYFVVFIGYTADDPPVLYLLEALNRGLDAREGLYAFQSGSAGEADSRWRHKGVHPIAYGEGENHKALWDTLAAWATRAKNVEAWYESTIELAGKGPEVLLPHERGQVAHVVSTLEGTRRFAASAVAPPADWLCVFDSTIRYSNPGHVWSWSSNKKGPYFDPFNAYALDSDPLPRSIEPDDYLTKREVPQSVWDCFAATRHDRQNLQNNSLPALSGHWSIHLPKLPARLKELGVWICRVANQPAAVWWASGRAGIHPDIQFDIRFQLERRKVTSSPAVRKAWRYIFEAWKTQETNVTHAWHELKASIDLDGWTTMAVRQLVLIHRPYLTVGRDRSRPKPPESSESLTVRDIVHLDVKYPSSQRGLRLPDKYIATAVREFRKNLEHAIYLETELGGLGLGMLAPIEPDPDLGGMSSERTRGISGAILFYVGLFKQLIEKNPKYAKQEYLAWQIDDETVFARLRIWACGDQRIVPAIEVGEVFCGLTDRVFWDSRHQRDLLMVLSKRWSEFSSEVKTELGRRLLTGPPERKGEEDPWYAEYRASSVLQRIHWLKSRGCDFSFDFEAESLKLRKFAPNWQEEYAKNAVASMEARGGPVQTDTEYSELLKVPLSDVFKRALELKNRPHELFVKSDPFAGLASQRPVRAFAALIRAAKREDYPLWAWKTFLDSDGRKSDKPKFTALIAERISRLRTSALVEIVRSVSDWLSVSSKVLLEKYPIQFKNVWKKILSILRSNPESAKSGVVRGSKEPDWIEEALSAPVGKLVQALMNDPQKQGIEAGKWFPLPWISRVDELLSLEGDLRRHALVMFGFNLEWFFEIDPAWAEKNLLSVLEDEGHDQSALWAGFFWRAKVPGHELYRRLKPQLLRLAKEKSLARHHHSEILAGIILEGWGTFDGVNGSRYVSDAEMRDVLINTDDDFRLEILRQLEGWSSKREEEDDNWARQLPLFLTDVWPRQKSVKSPRISAGLCDLAFLDANTFPARVDNILNLVTKVDAEYFGLNHLIVDDSSLVNQHPEKTLELLWAILPENAAVWPPAAEEVFERLGKAGPSLLKDSRLVELKRRWNAR